MYLHNGQYFSCRMILFKSHQNLIGYIKILNKKRKKREKKNRSKCHKKSLGLYCLQNKKAERIH